MQQIILNGKYRIIDSKFTKVGAYGAVFKAINIDTNEVFAIKEIKRTIGQEGIDCTVLRQKDILDHFRDNNIVTLIQYFINDNKAYLVFPYFDMNLREFIVKEYNSQVPPKIVKEIMKQLLSALKTAHNSWFMHRDVKLQNILIQKTQNQPNNFVIKLADWGASRKFNAFSNQNFTDYVIPRVYRPPELLFESKRYTQNVDIWSVGCLFYELIFGVRLFEHVSANLILQQIRKKIGLSESDDLKWFLAMYRKHNWDICQEDLNVYKNNSLDSVFIQKYNNVTASCDLMKKMLKINPDRRISASDALKHNYFDFNN